VNFRDNMPIVLAAGAVGLALAQWIHPFGNRVPPGVLIVVALLSLLRYFMRKQLQKRNRMVDEVPEHPLGLSDNSDKI